MGTQQHGLNRPRILLALQFWEGDKAKAGELARLIADIEPVRNKRADVLLSARFDTSPDDATVQYLGRRFNVYTAVGTTRLTGHPAGSFGLWHDTIRVIRDRCADGTMPRYTCCLVFEADCVPLSRKWIDELLDGWIKNHSRALAIGHEWHASKCPWPHINGNMMVSGRAEDLDTLAGWRGSPAKPWDIEIYPFLRQKGGVDSPLIRSLYIKKTPPGFMGRLRAIGAAFLHGDKDGTALALAREHVLRGKPFPDFSGTDGSVLFVDDEDPIPSVFEQLPGTKLRFPGEAARRYNPGLLKVPDGWLVAYRRIRLTDWASEIVLARFDDAWEFQSERLVTGLAEWPAGWLSYYEDPRLIPAPDGSVLLAYIHAAYNPARTFNQRAAILDTSAARVVRDVPLPFGSNSQDPGRQEKNWGFFYANDALHFVYGIHPHVVVRVSDMTTDSNTMVPGAHAWIPRYGEPRGGTPPVRVGPDRWVSFFHSRMPHKSREWRYHWGAYEFTVSARPSGTRSRVTRFTGCPLASGSERDGFLWPKGSCFWEPVVVFPTGAHFDGTNWVVAAGVNDSMSGVFRFDSNYLDLAFARKPPKRYSV